MYPVPLHGRKKVYALVYSCALDVMWELFYPVTRTEPTAILFLTTFVEKLDIFFADDRVFERAIVSNSAEEEKDFLDMSRLYSSTQGKGHPR